MSERLMGIIAERDAEIVRLKAERELKYVPIAQADEAVAEARREAAGEIVRLKAKLLEQGRELERWKQADAAALRERLGVLTDAAQRLLGVAMSHESIPREMAAPMDAFDELRRALAASGETTDVAPVAGAWPLIDGQTKEDKPHG